MTTLEPLVPIGLLPMELPLMQFAGASRAKTLAGQDCSEDLQGSDQDSGTNMRASLARFDRNTLSWRTSLRCFIEGWMRFSEPFPNSGTMRNGKIYQRQPWALPIAESAFGLLPTPRKSGQSRAWKAYKRKNSQGNLEEVLGDRGYSGWITPQFAVWMMGFDPSWVDATPQETPSSPKSPNSSDAQS